MQTRADLQLERYLRVPQQGSFEALVITAGIDLPSGKGEVLLTRILVGTQGRRWEHIGRGETFLALEEGGLVKVWRIDENTRTVHLVSQEPKAKASTKQRAVTGRRVGTETLRGFRCAVYEETLHSPEATLKAREWRVLEAKLRNWPLKADSHVIVGGQEVGLLFFETLQVRFKALPKQLFTLPSDYRVVP